MSRPYRLIRGDCLEVLSDLEPDSIDSVVTDPPYGLSFMGKNWDHGVPGVPFWEAVLRVAKPGAHLLSFGGTRTFHRLAVAIEDAGWEIRDTVMWVYGSGFPKSMDVSKAIDKAAGTERGVVGNTKSYMGGTGGVYRSLPDSTGSHKWTGNLTSGTPLTDEAKQWGGWGTALKPAWEPIIVARKPFKGTVAANVLRYGTGGLNIDGSRVGYVDGSDKEKALAGDAFKRKDTSDKGWSRPWMEDADRVAQMNRESKERAQSGRFPANLIHDGSDEVVDLLGESARFFYCAKASKSDRGEGNNHPTVKPTSLMRYLVRLVTPPRGLILDPFMGSGSTGRAAGLEGFRFVGIEKEREYMKICMRRVAEGYQ